MIGIHSDPPPSAIKDRNNGIMQVVYNLDKYLPEFGYQYVNEPRAAHLFVHHAGSSNGMPINVEHCHGLVPTAMNKMTGAADAINGAVIDNIMRARAVTVPSEWVADVIRRDMRFDPFVVPWGIEPSEWLPGENQRYVLWAKGRADIVCNPAHMNTVAHLLPGVNFVSTFGGSSDNVRIIGQQPFDRMKDILRNAGVYLATTRETFGIQTLEAMACGVPVAGFHWAGTPDIVKNGVHGRLVAPGDHVNLSLAIMDCLENRQEYGQACIEQAHRFTWRESARRIAEVYSYAMQEHGGPEVSVVIPCYNYAQYVAEAIESVLRQNLPCGFELIIVNDGSTDNSAEVIERYRGDPRVTIIHKENGGVSSARNTGFKASRGKYVVFLDADDKIENNFLRVNWDKMRKDDRLGISYTLLQLLTESGIQHAQWPPERVDYARLLRGDNQIPTCCMIRRTAFERVGGYKQRFEPTEDGELWARIVEAGFTAECATKTPLFTYRLGHASLSRGVRLPDYVGWHLPAKIGTPPCGMPRRNGAYPVRDYDAPVFSVVVIHGAGDRKLHDTLDSLLAQSYMFWDVHVVFSDQGKELPDTTAYPFVNRYEVSDIGAAELCRVGVDRSIAPFIVLVESGTILEGRFLESAVTEWQGGQCKDGVMPRVWYNELDESEKILWLAGVGAAEVPQRRTLENKGA